MVVSFYRMSDHIQKNSRRINQINMIKPIKATAAIPATLSSRQTQ